MALSPDKHVMEDTSHRTRPKVDAGDAPSLMGSKNLTLDFTTFRTASFFYRGSVRSHGRCGRGARYSGKIINAHHLSPPLPSRPGRTLRDAQGAAPRATDWTPRLCICDAQGAAPRATA
jgi:hypothetical protein